MGISFEDEISKKSLPLKLPSNNFITNFITVSYIGLICIYFLFRTPHVSAYFVEPIIPSSKVKTIVFKTLFTTGFDSPNVFNKTDLSMGNCWMEVYQIEDNKAPILTPLIGKDGERLNYNNFDFINFKNHNSDLLYFGTTLHFARSLISIDSKKAMEQDMIG